MATRENREGAPNGADAVQKRDFIRGVAIFPVAALTCWAILTFGGNSQDWGVGFLAVLAAGALALGGVIWTLVMGLTHQTFKISVLGLMVGLVLVGVVGGFV
ncbi:hypothetical protein [Ralstonia sp. 24A2]|uniref:hypothetical protein n=1 Tax=Ralstonia sp. 24A2 TaxID=3447364 RepID=UPI003F69F010